MSTCARCGAAFGCAMVDGATAQGAQPCWCMRLPAVVALPGAAASAGCWCPACLEQHIALRAAPSPATAADG